MEEIAMRTTLSIDDDVLAAAKGLANRDHKTVGDVISSLVRQALQPRMAGGGSRNGITLLPLRDPSLPVTPELIDQLQDELP
jgi:hypothetical protein